MCNARGSLLVYNFPSLPETPTHFPSRTGDAFAGCYRWARLGRLLPQETTDQDEGTSDSMAAGPLPSDFRGRLIPGRFRSCAAPTLHPAQTLGRAAGTLAPLRRCHLPLVPEACRQFPRRDAQLGALEAPPHTTTRPYHSLFLGPPLAACVRISAGNAQLCRVVLICYVCLNASRAGLSNGSC